MTMKKVNDNNKLAIQMLIAMVSGILVGLLFMATREYLGADSSAWALINKILFQDITAAGAESAIGLFYIGGQLFIRALQLIIVPSNIGSTLSVNNAVLGVVFISVVVGLSMNKLGMGKECVIYRFCEEISKIVVVFLSFAVKKFGPVAIFMLLSRTFATYGIDYLKPALAYCVLTVAILLAYLFVGYPLYISLLCKLNPIIFIKKIFKVIVFGFSTSSSAATLPLNLDTTTKELGVDRQVASFVLPLGMTINMDGTAIMQVIATLFVAGCGGFDVTAFQLVVIMVLALIASMGTPAAPGAGAVILFTILSGVGFTNDAALVAYALILAINRPIEMLVTALNVVGDAFAAVAVAKSEGKMNEDIYNA